MIVTCVHVWVKQEYINGFIEASKANHQGSVTEPGNMRFDVLQSVDDPAKFTLYEAYESKEAAAAHKETDHYKTWRETVAPMMEKPRKGDTHNVIAPIERSMW
jgi:(4S)-4-hydroxy-5-phosphonooxypentane-2,3-dione isomerase